MKEKKSDTVRIKEMIELRKKFIELGLDDENEQMKVLIAHMNDFARDAVGFSSKVDLSDFGRIAICKFTNQPRSVSTIVLKAIK
jgi:hypothetical protein